MLQRYPNPFDGDAAGAGAALASYAGWMS